MFYVLVCEFEGGEDLKEGSLALCVIWRHHKNGKYRFSLRNYKEISPVIEGGIILRAVESFSEDLRFS